MNRRSILRLLGLAPVVAPLAVAVAARAVTEPAPLSRAYGVSMAIDGQASAFSILATQELRAFEIHHPVFTDGPVTITA